jgi:hypothetical protein
VISPLAVEAVPAHRCAVRHRTLDQRPLRRAAARRRQVRQELSASFVDDFERWLPEERSDGRSMPMRGRDVNAELAGVAIPQRSKQSCGWIDSN